MAEKISVPIVSEYDDKGAKQALADAEKIDDLKPEVEIEADVSRVLSAFDDVMAETKEVQAAADALGRALGPELAAQADTTRIVQQLQEAGLAIDTIKSNADQLGGKLRELADADVGGRLGASLGTTRGKMDELAASASSSKSVLANMVGNATQDLGALSGVAGSAGVAIGQMGEYMADAAASGEGLGSIFKSFAGVAGPIAGIAIATQLISTAINKNKEEQEKLNKATETYLNTLVDAADAGENLNKALETRVRETVIDIIGGLSDADVRRLQQMGISFDEINEAITAGTGPAAEMVRIQDEMTAAQGRGFASGADKIKQEEEIAAAYGKTRDEVRDFTDIIGDEIDVQQQAIGLSKTKAEFVNAEAEATKATAEATEQQRAAREAANEQEQRYVDLLEQRADEADTQRRLNDQTKIQRDRLAAVNTEAERVDRARLLNNEKRAIEDVNRQYDILQGNYSDRSAFLQIIDDYEDWKVVVEDAHEAAQSGAEDTDAKMRDLEQTTLDNKQAVADYIVQLDDIPSERKTELLTILDQQGYDAAVAAIIALEQERTVPVNVKLNMPQWLIDILASGGDALVRVGPTALPPSGGAPTPAPVNVNVNMPSGSRGVDVLRQLSHQARRSGRRYGASVVHYARR